MSFEKIQDPLLKVNTQDLSSDDNDDIDKKLEEMKKEIAELEEDFSKQTLDELVNQQLSTARKSSYEDKLSIGDFENCDQNASPTK